MRMNRTLDDLVDARRVFVRHRIKVSRGDRFGHLFVRPLSTRRIYEHGVRRQFFEAQIDRPANRTGSMNRSCRNGDGLPRTEPQFGTTIKIDDQRAFDHEKQFV
jgi:hypothetical protein